MPNRHANPYKPPPSPDGNAAASGNDKIPSRVFLVLLPIAWLVFLIRSGIGEDQVIYSGPIAILMTIGTFIAFGVLAYSVRGWWHFVVLPVWLMLIMSLCALWFWSI